MGCSRLQLSCNSGFNLEKWLLTFNQFCGSAAGKMVKPSSGSNHVNCYGAKLKKKINNAYSNYAEVKDVYISVHCKTAPRKIQISVFCISNLCWEVKYILCTY
jgi:hypothetical protein